MKHTPGPWNIAGVHVDRGNIQIGSPEDYIAEVYGAPEDTEAYANAKLLAAAPELLEACKAMAEYISGQWKDEGGDRPNCLRLAEQTIKKVEGE